MSCIPLRRLQKKNKRAAVGSSGVKELGLGTSSSYASVRQEQVVGEAAPDSPDSGVGMDVDDAVHQASAVASTAESGEDDRANSHGEEKEQQKQQHQQQQQQQRQPVEPKGGRLRMAFSCVVATIKNALLSGGGQEGPRSRGQAMTRSQSGEEGRMKSPYLFVPRLFFLCVPSRSARCLL